MRLSGAAMRVAVAVAVASLVTGCAGGGTNTSPTVTSGLALLDFDTATFTVPIDAYGMSLQEVNIVNAAHAAAFAQCFTGRTTLDPDVLDNVRKFLTSLPMGQWHFGSWDAPFVAAHGFPGAGTQPSLWVEDLTDAQQTIAAACVNDNASVQVFEPVSPAFGMATDLGHNVQQLNVYWSDGFARTQSDQRYIDLNVQRNACITAAGYPVLVESGQKTGEIFYQNSWTAEYRNAAAVAGAKCADDMNYTQQVVDIVAAYQLQTIAKHQAELTAIRQELDDRVANATEFLKTVGVM